jgi:MoaA/NifB/PqqE/SkfB family radical SAM enzyme
MREIMKVASGYMKSILREQAYVRLGLDFTKPFHISLALTNSCNSKCLMCDCWRIKNEERVTYDRWMDWIAQFKAYNNNIKVCVAGGEIFLYDGAFKILEFCHSNNIPFNITTSGLLFNKGNARRILDLEPFDINIALDSLKDEVYEEIRGVPGLRTLLRNIDMLNEMNVGKRKTILNMKTILCRQNFSEIEDIVEFAKKKKFAAVMLSAVERTTEETHDMFNIDKKHLRALIDRMIAMKKEGYPIANSVASMNSWMDYFDERNIADYCTVPLSSIFLEPNGDVKLCAVTALKSIQDIYIGNLNQKSLASIMKSEKQKFVKKSLVYCKRNCHYCIRRGFGEYVGIAKRFIIAST